MKTKYGFTYEGVEYCWYEKKLYRLPFVRGGRNYTLKEIKPMRKGKVYNIQKVQKTIAQLKQMTIEFPVAKEIKLIISDDLPD